MFRFVASVVFAGALATSAMAADMRAPVYKADPMQMGYNWTGFYVGVHAGMGTGITDNTVTGAVLALPNAGSTFGFAGVQAGYRWHTPSNFVLGLQVSAPLIGTRSSALIFGNPNTVDFRWAVMGQAHLGYAMGRWLPFVIGGIGVGEVAATETLIGPPVVTGSVAVKHTLYTLGLGINYAITDRVTTGVRWNHLWTSRERYACGAPCGTIGNFALTADTVTAVLEWRF